MRSDSPAAVRLESCSFGYGHTPVLSNISLEVPAGAFVSIIGCNGAGKTTLLRLLTGELAPHSGLVTLFGRAVGPLTRIGYLPQITARAASFPATAWEIVLTGAYTGPLRPTGKRGKTMAMSALESVGMQAHAERLIGKLSGGQLQRVLVARALAGQPRLLLLDEPTSGVDCQAAQDIYRLLRELSCQQGLTVVMVTHDIAGTASHVDSCLCLKNGQLSDAHNRQGGLSC